MDMRKPIETSPFAPQNRQVHSSVFKGTVLPRPYLFVKAGVGPLAQFFPICFVASCVLQHTHPPSPLPPFRPPPPPPPGPRGENRSEGGGRDNLEIAPMGKKYGGGACLLAWNTQVRGERVCGLGFNDFFFAFAREARAKPKPEGRLNFSSSPPAHTIVIGRYLLCMLVVWEKGKGWRG